MIHTTSNMKFEETQNRGFSNKGNEPIIPPERHKAKIEARGQRLEVESKKDRALFP
jgi:hypothetical protein